MRSINDALIRKSRGPPGEDDALVDRIRGRLGGRPVDVGALGVRRDDRRTPRRGERGLSAAASALDIRIANRRRSEFAKARQDAMSPPYTGSKSPNVTDGTRVDHPRRRHESRDQVRIDRRLCVVHGCRDRRIRVELQRLGVRNVAEVVRQGT